jgi:nitroreductase
MSDRDTYQRILKLRAVRTFRPEPLSEEDLNAILEAARWTGSAKNSQDWTFIVVRDPDQKERLATAGNFTKPMRNAPCAIALVDESTGYEFDVGRAAQNIMLAADAIGVASCPVTLHKEERAVEVLGIPKSARARYAVCLGYATDEPLPKRGWGGGGRKALDKVVRWEKY